MKLAFYAALVGMACCSRRCKVEMTGEHDRAELKALRRLSGRRRGQRGRSAAPRVSS